MIGIGGPITLAALIVVGIETLRWVLRPEARRLRMIRRIAKPCTLRILPRAHVPTGPPQRFTLIGIKTAGGRHDKAPGQRLWPINEDKRERTEDP
jgi:hypothetical protein